MIENVTDSLRLDVREGRYRPGVKLPPHRELARKYDVSAASVQYAVRQLKTEGLLTGIRGSGTYVNHSVTPRKKVSAVVRVSYADLFSKRILNDIVRAFLSDFQSMHPDIRVQFEPKPQDILGQREHQIIPELFGRYSFTATVLLHDFIKDVAFHGQVADITSPAKRWESRDRIWTAAWDVCRWRGGVYGIPSTATIYYLLLYRPAFKGLTGARGIEAGFSSWEGIGDMRSSAAGKKNGRVRVLCNDPERLFYLWEHLLVQRGVDPFGLESLSHPALIGKHGADILGYLDGLLKSGVLILKEMKHCREMLDLFVGGEYPALFITNPDSFLSHVQGAGIPGSDIAILPLPVGPGGRNVQFLMNSAWTFSPRLAPGNLEAAVKMACYLSEPETHALLHRRVAEVFPEARHWLPLGKDLDVWDRATPNVMGPWKEYMKEWLPKATAKPAAPFWTPDIFREDLRAMAREEAFAPDAMLAAHRQEVSMN